MLHDVYTITTSMHESSLVALDEWLTYQPSQNILGSKATASVTNRLLPMLQGCVFPRVYHFPTHISLGMRVSSHIYP